MSARVYNFSHCSDKHLARSNLRQERIVLVQGEAFPHHRGEMQQGQEASQSHYTCLQQRATGKRDQATELQGSHQPLCSS